MKSTVKFSVRKVENGFIVSFAAHEDYVIDKEFIANTEKEVESVAVKAVRSRVRKILESYR